MPLSPPDPPLRDADVALRPWRLEDAAAMRAAIDGDEAIASWLEQIPQPYGEADARAYLESVAAGWADGTSAAFAIVDARTGELLGSLGIRIEEPEQGNAEVGYWVARGARGRGVASRALRLASRWALREGGLERLQLRAEVRNEPSQRVAEKAGFHQEGIMRSARFNPRQGRRMDWVLYSLIRTDLTGDG
jgi:RimJ/RimL family protein N-acetyltransferase